jgi:hypothetical protein
MSEVTQAARFWRHVDRRAESECWPWQGGRGSTGDGYGRVSISGKMRPATQVAWEIENGKPFPSGKIACHSCDNSICVNPAHIWPGTQSENLSDCVSKGRHKSKPQAHCKRGHPMNNVNRRPTQGGFRCGACSRENTRLAMRRLRARRRAENA